MTPVISEAQLHELEAVLYARAMDGDSRLGLYLLRLYYKDLRMVEQQLDADQCGGLIVLPVIDDGSDDDA